MTTQTEASPVLGVAKSRNQPNEVTLSTGVKVIIKGVAASLIDEVMSSIKNPEIPMWHNPDRDRDEPNPGDPIYLNRLEEADKARSNAGMDAMIMFGIELVDGVPPVDEWIGKLRFMEKRGRLDLSQYDMNDELDVEFLYKKYCAVGAVDITLIGNRVGLSADDVEDAKESFRGN